MLSHLHCLHAEIGLEKGSNFFVENNIVQLNAFMLVSHRNTVTKMNLLVVTKCFAVHLVHPRHLIIYRLSNRLQYIYIYIYA